MHSFLVVVDFFALRIKGSCDDESKMLKKITEWSTFAEIIFASSERKYWTYTFQKKILGLILRSWERLINVRFWCQFRVTCSQTWWKHIPSVTLPFIWTYNFYKPLILQTLQILLIFDLFRRRNYMKYSKHCSIFFYIVE